MPVSEVFVNEQQAELIAFHVVFLHEGVVVSSHCPFVSIKTSAGQKLADFCAQHGGFVLGEISGVASSFSRASGGLGCPISCVLWLILFVLVDHRNDWRRKNRSHVDIGGLFVNQRLGDAKRDGRGVYASRSESRIDRSAPFQLMSTEQVIQISILYQVDSRQRSVAGLERRVRVMHISGVLTNQNNYYGAPTHTISRHALLSRLKPTLQPFFLKKDIERSSFHYKSAILIGVKKL